MPKPSISPRLRATTTFFALLRINSRTSCGVYLGRRPRSMERRESPLISAASTGLASSILVQRVNTPDVSRTPGSGPPVRASSGRLKSTEYRPRGSGSFSPAVPFAISPAQPPDQQHDRGQNPLRRPAQASFDRDDQPVNRFRNQHGIGHRRGGWFVVRMFHLPVSCSSSRYK